jgi:hypothetical protein
MHRSPFSRGHSKAALVVVLALSAVLVGCATTRATRGAEPQGFLGDYSQLREGEGDEAQLVYINRLVNFSKYNAVIIDSVTFWETGESKLSKEDKQALTDELYLSLDTKLKERGFATVERPGPNVLRLRAAITEARGAKVVANAVTSIVPQTRLITTLGGMATDKAVLVGKAGIEVELQDSLSGQRVAAGVDERVGTKTIRGAFGEWKHVTEAFDYWAGRIAKRLEELRSAG